MGKKFFIDVLQAKHQFVSTSAALGMRLFEKNPVLQCVWQQTSSQILQLSAQVQERGKTYAPQLEFHRQTALLKDTSCDCEVKKLCGHSYAVLVAFERQNKSHQRPSGVIDASSHFLDEQALQQIQNASQVWSQQQQAKELQTSRQSLLKEAVDVLFCPAQAIAAPLIEEMVLRILCHGKNEQYQIELSLLFAGKPSQAISLCDLCDAIVQKLPFALSRKSYFMPAEQLHSSWVELLFEMKALSDAEGFYAQPSISALLLKAVDQPHVTVFWSHAFHPLQRQEVRFDFQVHIAEQQKGHCGFTFVPQVQGQEVEATNAVLLDATAPFILILDQERLFLSSEQWQQSHIASYRYLIEKGLSKSLMPSFVDTTLKQLPACCFWPQDVIRDLKAPALPLRIEVLLDLLSAERISVHLTFCYGSWHGEVKSSDFPLFDDEMDLSRNFMAEKEALQQLLPALRFDAAFDRLSLAAEEFPQYYHTLQQGSLYKSIDCQLSAALQKKIISLSQLPHIEVRASKQSNFFEVGFMLSEDPLQGVDLLQLRQLLPAPEKMIYSKRGQYLLLDDKGRGKQQVESLVQLLEGWNVEELKLNEVHLLSRWQLWHLHQFSQQQKISFDTQTEQILHRDLSLQKLQEATARHVPEAFCGELRLYQKQGLDWICRLHDCGFAGILADEMGLGKTIQTIAFLISEKSCCHKAQTLLICPTSLIYNWHSELQRFAPTLSSVVMEGSVEKRQRLLQISQKVDVLITSYPLLQKDIELYLKYHFHYVILDEAQHIKNPATRNAQLAKQIRCDYRLILTGTPIENSLKDLWSLFDFILPGFLHNYATFCKLYPAHDLAAQRRLKKSIEPFILRRKKQDVLTELPPVTHITSSCELYPEQKQLYKKFVQEWIDRVDQQIERGGEQKARMHILAGITRLKQLCCHPKLWSIDAPSAKFDLLMELVDELVDGGHRAIIFSQYTKMLRLIAQELKCRHLQYSYLDGSTKDRLQKVQEFNGNAEIGFFLISLRAGGSGLNLVGANCVIHYDLWWNPAVENQATDRVHRIGQTKNVSSYKIIAQGTIEQKILQVQEDKKELIQSVLGDASYHLLQQMSWKDIKEKLFEFNA